MELVELNMFFFYFTVKVTNKKILHFYTVSVLLHFFKDNAFA